MPLLNTKYLQGAGAMRCLLGIDGLGAILSALALGIFGYFEVAMGIPRHVLWAFIPIPVCYAVCSLGCYVWLPARHSATWLRIMACANVFYACIVLVLICYHSSTLASWGWAYFVAEVGVLIALAIVELQVARRYVRHSAAPESAAH